MVRPITLLLAAAAALAAPSAGADWGKGPLPAPVAAATDCRASASDRSWWTTDLPSGTLPVPGAPVALPGGVLFRIPCPGPSPEAREAVAGEVAQWFAYVHARDRAGTGARRLTFEVRRPDGALATLDRMPDIDSMYMRPGEFEVSWRPREASGICSTAGEYRLEASGMRLVVWRELPCGKDLPTDWIARLDRRTPSDTPDLLRIALGSGRGDEGCFTRTYDAAHLEAHPAQTVTAMTLHLQRDAARDPPDVFKLFVQRKGRKRPVATSGFCGQGTQIVCNVECDGGGIAVDLDPKGDGVLVRLDRGPGYVRMEDCGEELTLTGGADDRVFRLAKAPPALCRTMSTRLGYEN